jgi:AraC family transcriptional regulator
MKLIDEYIDQNGAAVVEMRDLAAIAALPLASFSRLFKQTHGQSPYQYVLQRRIQKAYGLIDRSTLSLAQIAFQCGFSSQSHMTDVFRNKLGVTPGQIRRHLV